MSLLIGHLYRFGAFTLDSDQRILLLDGKPLPLAPKAFETLLALVESSGRIVSKEALMNRLWPDTFVEESNLAFNIQQLRRTLGDNARKPVYIETVARRGYRFIATIEALDSDESETPSQRSVLTEIHDAQPGKDLSTSSGRRTFLIATVVIVALAAVTLIAWQVWNRWNKAEPIADSFSPGSALKLEKLTQTGQSRQVAISADGKYIAYTRVIEGKSGIWVRQLATNTNVEIVPPTGILYGLSFANDGQSLYFVRGDPIELFRVSLLGGVPTKIADALEGGFSISSDDKQIAFIRRSIQSTGRRQYSLVIKDSTGTDERTVLNQMYPDKLANPLWSPDNHSIICAEGSSEAGSQSVSIVEISVADGAKHRLSQDRFFHIGRLAWLPHKAGLMMTARKNLQDNKELWRVSYPGMQIEQLTNGLSAYLDLSIAQTIDRAVATQATHSSFIWVGPTAEPTSAKKITQAIDAFCWTPNGRLVYQSTAGGNRDLWITQPNGGEQRQLTNDSTVDGNPAVTADNRYIVFTSNRTGQLQLWRMDVDGGNLLQLTSGDATDYPAVSPDGKWVLYNTTDNWHLWRVSIDGGSPVRLTNFQAYFAAVSPDGRMIACVGRNEAKQEHSILILPFEGGPPIRRIDSTDAGFANYRMVWTRDGKALIYARDGAGPTVLSIQSIDGSIAHEIMRFDGDELFDFGYSPDGKFFAATRGEWQHDVVLITTLRQ